MQFCTWQFLVFFLVVFTAYWSSPWHQVRVWILLIASFTFYAAFSKQLACIVLGSTVLDYFIARALDSSTSPFKRRALLTISICANLALLVYFKYANFFLASFGETMQALGLSASMPTLKILVPIGISFYTFEAINYVVDVYLRKAPAEKNLAHFMLFILFFPHLVAGPIVRARDFLPQIRRRKHWSWGRLHLGLQLVLLGLVKKLAIADRMAQFADPIFESPELYGSYASWLGAVAYALQVYCDFSGYTDLALGTAHMLGYRLAQNFNMPYISANIAEFWRRWHISLSTWLRDYLFIPLGGSRRGLWITCRNLVIVMGLGGLWHGASWHYVVFGVIQGLMLVAHRVFRAFCERRPLLNQILLAPAGTSLRIAFTFTTFICSLVIFRCETLQAGFTMLGRMLLPANGHGSPMYAHTVWITFAVVALAHVLAQRDQWKKLLAALPAPLRGFAYASALTLALALAPEVSKAFIYFQF